MDKISVFDEILSENFEFELGSNSFQEMSDSEILDRIKSKGFQKGDGNKFWGWTCGPAYTLSLNEGNEIRTCCYRIMGLKNHCDEYPADDLPGTNPKLLDD